MSAGLHGQQSGHRRRLRFALSGICRRFPFQCSGDVQRRKHALHGVSAGAPQRRSDPLRAAGKGVAPYHQGIDGLDAVIIQIIAGVAPAAPLDGQHLLTAEQPPVDVRAFGHGAYSRHGLHRGVHQAQTGGDRCVGQGLQHHRGAADAPLGGAVRSVVDDHGSGALAGVQQFLSGQRIGSGRAGIGAAGSRAAGKQDGTQCSCTQQTDPNAFHGVSSFTDS